jgi:2-methylisocitrate lyase-like PEP mutase family enzyme
LADTKKCLQAFEEAGADLFYAPSLHDLATIRTRCHSVTKPVNVVMGMPGATFDLAQLAEAGVKRVSVGSALARVALGAFLTSVREMMDQGSFRFADRACGFAEIEAHFDACSAMVTAEGLRL